MVAAVSRAGGFGVLGATAHSPETLERELKWIDDHADGKPYGVDVLIPENISTAGEKDVTWKSLEARISPAHRDFTRNLLKKYGIELTTTNVADNQPQPFDAQRALELLDVSFDHPIRLIANALGVPPKAMIDRGKKHNVPVAALVGAKEHALRQVAAGVDILVVQGTEAGGHCGEVSTMVLVPEVIKAIKPIRDVPVLAAGGIMTGRQMAACMAMGAAGAWTGSVWLATVESETTEIFREKMIAASSRDAIRSKAAPENRRGNSVRCGPTPGIAGPTAPARCRCRCRASSAATPSTRSIVQPQPAIRRRAISSAISSARASA